MKVAMALAAAAVVASTGGAFAAAKQISFTDFFGNPTGCGLSITFSDVVVFPGDPKSLAAAKPSGACARTGVAVGAIGTGTVGGQTGRFLTLGQNENHTKNKSILYVIQLSDSDKLIDGGLWAQFDTEDGKNVNLNNGGTYSLGKP
jgi:hypothetical protein